MKRLTIAAATGASLSLAVATPTAGAVPSAATSITWGPCTDPSLVQGGAECGSLAVPLDRSKPYGRTIQLALARVRHKVPDSAYQGILLTVPNPLGGVGLTSPLLASRLPNGAGDAYDWVGFARRGLAPSVPALTCVPDYFGFNRPDYVTTTPSAERPWLDRVRGYADACASNDDQADLLAHMKTTDTASDMESIRIALGTDHLNLYSEAYGTYVAQVYATLFPSRVRRMVLDGSVDPRRVWYGAAAFDQDVPLERNLHIWFDWLASHDDVYHLGATRDAVHRVWNEQVSKVTSTPAAGAVGPDEWIDLFLFPAYTQDTFSLLGSVFSNFVNKGDDATLKALFTQFYQQPGNENTYAALLAEVCTDAPWPTNWRQWRADSNATNAQAPNTTWGNTWFNAPCLFWHAKPSKPVPIDGYGVQSALLIVETLDAVTPLEGSLEVRSRFPNSALISEPGGTTYSGTLRGNTCVDSKIAAYLTTGALPARKPGRQADVACAPLPLPNP